MKKFLLSLILLTVSLMLVAVAFAYFTSLFNSSIQLLVGTVFFKAVIALMTYFISNKGNTSDSNIRFQTSVMGSMGMRMALSLIFLIFYFLMISTVDIAYIIFYLILYLFFIMFEIYHLVINLRHNFRKTR